MNASYTFIDHTADVLFEAKAPTLEELFRQCALAVEDTQVNLADFSAQKEVEITGKNAKIDLLLFDFLDDLLFYKDSEMLLFCEFEISIEKKDEVYHLHCIAKGDVLVPGKQEQKVDVKAITLHMFEVKEINGGWNATVLLDI